MEKAFAAVVIAVIKFINIKVIAVAIIAINPASGAISKQTYQNLFNYLKRDLFFHRFKYSNLMLAAQQGDNY